MLPSPSSSVLPVTFDYRLPVTSWPHQVRIRWPNTIATLVLMERERIAGASQERGAGRSQ